MYFMATSSSWNLALKTLAWPPSPNFETKFGLKFLSKVNKTSFRSNFTICQHSCSDCQHLASRRSQNTKMRSRGSFQRILLHDQNIFYWQKSSSLGWIDQLKRNPFFSFSCPLTLTLVKRARPKRVIYSHRKTILLTLFRNQGSHEKLFSEKCFSFYEISRKRKTAKTKSLGFWKIEKLRKPNIRRNEKTKVYFLQK